MVVRRDLRIRDVVTSGRDFAHEGFVAMLT